MQTSSRTKKKDNNNEGLKSISKNLSSMLKDLYSKTQSPQPEPIEADKIRLSHSTSTDSYNYYNQNESELQFWKMSQISFSLNIHGLIKYGTSKFFSYMQLTSSENYASRIMRSYVLVFFCCFQWFCMRPFYILWGQSLCGFQYF